MRCPSVAAAVGVIVALALTTGRAATPAPAFRDAVEIAQDIDPFAPEPWPDDDRLAQRRREAEQRALFRDAAPLEFTLTFDFKAVDRERNPESTTTFPATITFPQDDGTTASRELKIRGRGHSRRNPKICDFIPLRLEFERDAMAGTVFEGHNALKLGTHCRSVAVFEQYVLREYTAYRILNLLTPVSFRARLARATYVDSVTGDHIDTRYGMFLENDDDVARRAGGRIREQTDMLFRHFDPDYLSLMTLFQYLIANTDFSISRLHNIRVVDTPTGRRYPVPYDFDYSGLVDATYASVSKSVPDVTSVRDRVYRGPCRSKEELEVVFARLRATKGEILALYDDLPAFTDASRREATSYLEEAYRTIDRPADVERIFIDRCIERGL